MTIEELVNYWNDKPGKPWHHHCGEITNKLIEAYKERLKHMSIKEICGAIDNYNMVLTSKEFTWSRKWPLYLFLTIHRPHTDTKNNENLQIYRFCEDVFIEDNYLTDHARRERWIRENHRPKQQEQFEEVPIEDRIKIRNEIIRKMRKEGVNN